MTGYDGKVVFATELDESGVRKGLSGLSSSVSGLGAGIGAALGTLGAGLAAGLINGARDIVSSAISAASSLNEVQNVVDTTFGGDAGRINQWAKSAKEAYGMGELAAKRYSSTMGAMFKSMGLASDATVDMSLGIAGLTGDMASFYNLDYETAFDKLRSGISGETEPLKQLGINMSVANLEAFALSQGIGKAYEKMSQAEQTTLRYNYLMKATADAQGDFAKTSGGYANQQRVLQTTQEELAATIGEVLLPIALEGTKALNEMVGGIKDAVEWVSDLLNPPKSDLDNQIDDALTAVDKFNGAISKAGNNLNTSLDSAKATQATAMSLLSSYEKINSKNVLTEQDTAQLQTIAKQIVALYPDMGAVIDSTTGLFNTNTGAVKDNIKALADQQLAMAYYSATQDYQKALIDATVAEAKAKEAHQAVYDDWVSKNQFAESAIAMRDALQSGAYNADVLEEYAGSLIALSPSFAQYFEIAEDGSYKLTKLAATSVMTGSSIAHGLNAQVAYYSGQAQVASDKSQGLYNTLLTTQEGVVTASEGMETATEAVSTLGYAFVPPTTNAENYADATGKVSDETKVETAETLKLREALTKLNQDTLKQIDAQVNGFEKIKKVRPKSTKQTVKDVNSQTKYLEDYAANFKKAKEKGVSPEALATLSEVTDENAAILAGLATAKAKEITNFNTAYAESNTAKAELTQFLADEQAQLLLANQNLADTTTLSDNAVAQTAKTVSDWVAASETNISTSVTNIGKTLDGAKTTLHDKAVVLYDSVVSGLTGDGTGGESETEAGASGGIPGAGSAIIDQFAKGMEDNDSIKGVIKNKVLASLSSARTGTWQPAYSLGQYLVSGIAAGATSKGGFLNATLTKIIKDAVAAAKLAAGINSPSKLFAREVGAPIAEGIEYGITNRMPGVLASISKSVAESAQAGKAALDNTLLGSVQSIAGIGYAYPSAGAMSAGIMRGSALMAYGSGGTDGSAETTVYAPQTINFNREMQAPDEIARSIRRQTTYGLAGARR